MIFTLGFLQELYPHGGVQYFLRKGGARNAFSKLPRNGNQRQSNPTQVIAKKNASPSDLLTLIRGVRVE
jgi:hypothetical protein